MKTIIFCNQLPALEKSLLDMTSSSRFLNLMESPEGTRISRFMRDRSGSKELNRAELFRERSAEFRDKYIEFMGRLNILNRSHDWWSFRFTTKNPLSTTLCRNVSEFLLIAELLDENPESLVVATENVDLVQQLKFWANLQGIQVINVMKSTRSVRKLLRRRTPASILVTFLKTFRIWLRCRHRTLFPNLEDEHLLITTLSNPNSFVGKNHFRDPYFSDLLNHIPQESLKPIVLAMMPENPFQQLKKLECFAGRAPIVPLEACLTLPSILTCLIQTLLTAFKPTPLQGDIEIDGRDLTCLVRRAIDDSRRSGDAFLDRRLYYCSLALSRKIRISRWIYPFENRSFEKMLLLGVRKGSPNTFMVGYQHASLTLSHTNFIFAKGEARYTPLPDLILTTGKLITNWLETTGEYPKGIIKTACALRQSPRDAVYLKKNLADRRIRVLVALATNLEEYVRTLVFLDEAMGSNPEFEIRIRPHPEYRLETAINRITPIYPDWFSASSGSLQEDLSWADVVIYASSTVSLEAVFIGIPVIYLDLGTFLDTDPMFGWAGLRWSVKDPSELADTINSIMNLSEQELHQRQQSGRDYVTAYLTPRTTEHLETFWTG